MAAVGKLYCNLNRRISAPDDDHSLPTVTIRIAVRGRVKDFSLKDFLSVYVRRIGIMKGTGRIDDRSRQMTSPAAVRIEKQLSVFSTATTF
jgi:hypothetical protein